MPRHIKAKARNKFKVPTTLYEPMRLKLSAHPDGDAFMRYGVHELIEVYQTVDKDMKSLQDFSKCCKGCTRCCAQLFSASVAEAVFLLAWMSQFKQQRTDRLVAKMSDSSKQAYKYKMEAKPWFVDENYCPLLENDLCSVYPARFLACRSFLVHESYDCTSTEEQIGILHHEGRTGALSAVASISETYHLPHGLIPYPAALVMATRFLEGGYNSLRAVLEAFSGQEVTDTGIVVMPQE